MQLRRFLNSQCALKIAIDVALAIRVLVTIACVEMHALFGERIRKSQANTFSVRGRKVKMKQLAYALPILALASVPAFAQEETDYGTAAAPDATASEGVQIPPYDPVRGPRAGSWEATVSGSGASLDQFDANSFGVTGSLGYYITPWLPVGVRQNIVKVFGDDVSDNWAGFTNAFIDFQAPLGAFQPFIGFLVGAQYGDIDEKLIYGPEGGIKYWVNESTFLYGLFEWKALEGEAFDNGNAVYSIGFGLNF